MPFILSLHEISERKFTDFLNLPEYSVKTAARTVLFRVSTRA